MENINYITNFKGEKIGLQINLRPKKKMSSEDIEEIEDIISYELLKDQQSLDYNTEINILENKMKTKHEEYLEKQMQDPEFRAYYILAKEKAKLEF